MSLPKELGSQVIIHSESEEVTPPRIQRERDQTSKILADILTRDERVTPAQILSILLGPDFHITDYSDHD